MPDNPIHDCCPVVCLALLSKAFELLKRGSRAHDYDFDAEAKAEDFVLSMQRPASEINRLYTDVAELYRVKKQRWYEGVVPDESEKLLNTLEECLHILKYDIIVPLKNRPSKGDTKAVLKAVKNNLKRVFTESKKALKTASDGLRNATSSLGMVAADPILSAIKRTVVSVDLSQYGRLSDAAEGLFAASAVLEYNDQIEKFISETAQRQEDDPIFIHTGDGAILVFNSADKAVQFAEEVHRVSQNLNYRIRNKELRAHYRIGVSTGEIASRETRSRFGLKLHFRLGGTTIGRSVRLQSNAHTGEVVICEDTWGALTDSFLKQSYRDCGIDKFPGKSHEDHIEGRRKKIVERAVWDKPKEAGPT